MAANWLQNRLIPNNELLDPVLFFRSVVPIRYRNTRGNLGELEIAWKTLALRARVSTSISRSPKLPRVLLTFYTLYGNRGNVFYFLNINKFNDTIKWFSTNKLMYYYKSCLLIGWATYYSLTTRSERSRFSNSKQLQKNSHFAVVSIVSLK